MWIATIGRVALQSLLVSGVGDFVQYVKHLPSTSNFPVAEPRQLIVVWGQDPRVTKGAPTGVVCRRGETGDLLAWLLTYYGSARPVTSQLRVLDIDTAQSYNNSNRLGGDFPVPNPSLAGAVVGATLEWWSGDLPVEAISFKRCSQSALWVLARAFALGYEFPAIRNAIDRWHSVVIADGQPHAHEREIAVRMSQVITSKALQANSKSLFLSESDSIKGFIDSARILGQAFDSEITHVAKNFDQKLVKTLLTDGSREEKVRAYEILVDRVSFMNVDPFSLSCLLGYFGSRIGQGSFEHWSIVLQASKKVPGSLMWYGFFAGTSGFGGRNRPLVAVARRVMRELSHVDAAWSFPRSDVQAEEWDMLHIDGKLSERVDLTFPGMAEIEVLPEVTFAVRTLRDAGQDKAASKVSEKYIHEIDSVLEDLQTSIKESEYLQKRIRKIVQESFGRRRNSSRKGR